MQVHRRPRDRRVYQTRQNRLIKSISAASGSIRLEENFLSSCNPAAFLFLYLWAWWITFQAAAGKESVKEVPLFGESLKVSAIVRQAYVGVLLWYTRRFETLQRGSKDRKEATFLWVFLLAVLKTALKPAHWPASGNCRLSAWWPLSVRHQQSLPGRLYRLPKLAFRSWWAPDFVLETLHCTSGPSADHCLGLRRPFFWNPHFEWMQMDRIWCASSSGVTLVEFSVNRWWAFKKAIEVLGFPLPKTAAGDVWTSRSLVS